MKYLFLILLVACSDNVPDISHEEVAGRGAELTLSKCPLVQGSNGLYQINAWDRAKLSIPVLFGHPGSCEQRLYVSTKYFDCYDVPNTELQFGPESFEQVEMQGYGFDSGVTSITVKVSTYQAGAFTTRFKGSCSCSGCYWVRQ